MVFSAANLYQQHQLLKIALPKNQLISRAQKGGGPECVWRDAKHGARDARAPRNCRALTILEMLVSTALLAFIVLGLTAMFIQTQKAFKTGIKQTTITDAGRTIIDMIASDFSQMSDPHFTNVWNAYTNNSGQTYTNPPTLDWSLTGMNLFQVVSSNNGAIVYRTNELDDIFTMERTNNTWIGVGYAVSNWFTNSDGTAYPGVGTLYRYTTNINGPLSVTNSPLIYGFQSAIYNNFTNCHRIADGVVHLKVYAYDADGNEDRVQLNPLNTSFQYPLVLQNWTNNLLYVTNYLPHSIDIELGILEPEAFEHARALFTSGADQRGRHLSCQRRRAGRNFPPARHYSRSAMNLKTNICEDHEAPIGRVRLCRTPCRLGQGAKPSPRPSPNGRGCGFQENAQRGVALVITLLMLSVITFLAIAFLSMTKRDRSAVTATLDVDTARAMSDAALARAQTEIIAQMMAQGDILSYDYMASHNFINQLGFNPNDTNRPDSNNVNYDYVMAPGNPSYSGNPVLSAENIGNLFYDPRPPVFVMTNGNLSQPSNDFRFWVDINRNGRFETNGYQPLLDQKGSNVPNVTIFNHGEPEWIGVLKYPQYFHSPTNPFVGRYAFMVLPIGKTLDLNYIHNYSKFAAGEGGTPQMTVDGSIRDEGVGSWELNLAALLQGLSPAMYQTNSTVTTYQYVPGSGTNTGGAFDDASQFLSFRYGANALFPQTLLNVFGNNDLLPIGITNIDEFGSSPSPFDYITNITAALAAAKSDPWPGAYNSNTFYDVQDFFDPQKTGQPGVTLSDFQSHTNFIGRLAHAVSLLDTTNRYTFQRLLDCIGTSSEPEYGTYVYSNLSTSNGTTLLSAVPPPSLLRTKVNINYDNTAQIQAGPYNWYGGYTPMPTNLAPWTPLGFFTNAADLLLRSQVYAFTNYLTNSLGQYITNSYGQYVQANAPTNFIYATFGITNIPVYVSTNPSVRYNEQIHRMLQLAANIYAAAYPSNIVTANGLAPQPPVFRPQFAVGPSLGGTNTSVTITGFVQVTNDAYTRISKGFYDVAAAPPSSLVDGNFNFWGIPWVVGAVKGLPAFDQVQL